MRIFIKIGVYSYVMVLQTGTTGTIRASPSENSVTRNGKKIGSYFRKINGKKFSYNGFDTSKKELERIAKFRKDRFGFKNRIIKVKGGYISYTGN